PRPILCRLCRRGPWRQKPDPFGRRRWRGLRGPRIRRTSSFRRLARCGTASRPDRRRPTDCPPNREPGPINKRTTNRRLPATASRAWGRLAHVAVVWHGHFFVVAFSKVGVIGLLRFLRLARRCKSTKREQSQRRKE